MAAERGISVHHRDRDIDSLFQRIAAAGTADPMTAIDAARAVDEWPLLAMLTPPLPPLARTPHHMMMPVEETAPPLAGVTHAAAPAPEPEPAFELQPEAAAAADETHLSPLEQLFHRAERTGKPQTLQPRALAPAEQVSAPLSAPPPLKVPTQRRPAPTMTRPAAAVSASARSTPAAERPVTIEPRAKEWHAPDMVPEHLFERVGGR
jgi:hypothetical protein